MITYWLRFVVQYTLLGMLLKFNGGMLDVHVDGATINHLTFFFQTWQLLGNFGDADMYGMSLLLERHSESGAAEPADSAEGGGGPCEWKFDGPREPAPARLGWLSALSVSHSRAVSHDVSVGGAQGA
jgi:hypothetical protein